MLLSGFGLLLIALNLKGSIKFEFRTMPCAEQFARSDVLAQTLRLDGNAHNAASNIEALQNSLLCAFKDNYSNYSDPSRPLIYNIHQLRI